MIRRAVSLSTLFCLVACGGRAVNLDGPPTATAGTSSRDEFGSIETLDLQNSIVELWADESRIYWAETGNTMRSCVYAHCSTTLVTYGISSYSFTLGADDVFFDRNTLSNSILRCPKVGCTGQPEEVVRDRSSAITADSEYLYWSSDFDIYRCPVSGCGEFPEVVVKSENADGALLVEGGEVFWNFAAGGPPARGDTEIHSAPKDGSRLPMLVANGVGFSPIAVNIAVDATRVYWLDYDSHVQSCPRAGCGAEPPVTLVSTNAAKQDLRVDAAGVYWREAADLVGNWFRAQGSNVDNVSVRFCPLSGCAAGVEPKTLTPHKTAHFALDSTYLYWTEHQLQSGGAFSFNKGIYRVAKPQPEP